MSLNDLLHMIVQFKGVVKEEDIDVFFNKELIFTENKTDRKYKLSSIGYYEKKTEKIEIEVEEI